jgi:hypothetical protein
VSGKVTERTEIVCGVPPEDNDQGDNDRGDNDQGDRGDNDQGDNDQGDRGDNDQGDHSGGGGPGPSGHGGGPGPSGGADEEHGGMGAPGEVPVCGTSALVSGAKVQEAELSISSFGAFWEKVRLSA